MSETSKNLLMGNNKSASEISLMNFVLPPELGAGEPPEARGLARDEVRLMVSYRLDNRIVHTQFRQLPNFLEAGDVVVVNTSGTMNAALPAMRSDGEQLELHLSTHLPADLWIVEMRQQNGRTTKLFTDVAAGDSVQLPADATATLHMPYHHQSNGPQEIQRLWIATLHLPCPIHEYLTLHGFPIRYSYVKEHWPLSYYQTVYATEEGSAEMPSAGRAFTPELITLLVAQGVHIVPLLLHTGVASLEAHEPPYEEYYRVPSETARTINAARKTGKRIIAVGTTVVRTLETVVDTEGVIHPAEGWTNLVIRPHYRICSVDALLTGLHEPRASHLLMLEALAKREHLQLTYDAALQEKYLWHEFGDLHLLMP